jgi:methylenetetrahydrofolate dehydrogenase (NADP+)/methenyltetrahydrofolate cyclohydrolase
MKDLASEPIAEALRAKIQTLTAESIDRGNDPQLAIILVGSHPASLTYVKMKEKAARELGIILSVYHLEEGTQFAAIEETVRFLASDPEVHGLIVQLPLPTYISSGQTDTLLSLIPTDKDVDGLNGVWNTLEVPEPSIAAFLEKNAILLPPMVGSIISLLDFYGYSPKGKHVVLVGAGRLVGKPMAAYFQKIGVSVTVVDEETPDIISHTQKADILITGTGQRDLVTYQWIKEGVVVLNASGDVHVDSVTQLAEALSPEKGGIGPLTVTWLLYNTVHAASRKEIHE